MANIEEILVRARTIATQMATDANLSIVIDNKAGLRALLPHAIREVYVQKAKDPKFIKDINVKNTISMAAGVGTVPTNIFREFLHQAEYADVDGSLISYFDYAVDANSGVNFDQLGYVTIQGDSIYYTPPAPGTSTSYGSSLYMTIPSYPAFPVDPDDDIPMNSDTTDGVILLLAHAIIGKVKFDLDGAILA